MKQYQLVLKNEKIKSYKIIGWIVIIGNIVALFILAAINNFQKPWPVILAVIALVSILVTVNLNAAKKISPLLPAYVILAVAWFLNGYILVGFILLLFGVLHAIAIRPFIVEISSSNIIYPSFPQKKIKWNELSNLMLKDGLLTIDLKTNQLIQQIVDEIQMKFDEKEFNEFCRTQLKK